MSEHFGETLAKIKGVQALKEYLRLMGMGSPKIPNVISGVDFADGDSWTGTSTYAVPGAGPQPDRIATLQDLVHALEYAVWRCYKQELTDKDYYLESNIIDPTGEGIINVTLQLKLNKGTKKDLDFRLSLTAWLRHISASYFRYIIY